MFQFANFVKDLVSNVLPQHFAQNAFWVSWLMKLLEFAVKLAKVVITYQEISVEYVSHHVHSVHQDVSYHYIFIFKILSRQMVLVSYNVQLVMKINLELAQE